MSSKAVWVFISCLMVTSLVLASCAPAPATPTTPTRPTTPVTPTTPAAPAKPAAPAAPAPAGPEMVKVTLKNSNGETVEKLVEKPRYGGVLTYALASDASNFHETIGTGAKNAYYLTNEDLLIGDWAKSAQGTGEASFVYTMPPPLHLYRGSLAESWELREPDTLVFHIRKGVRFHDKPPANGRELTANDVVSSLKTVWQSPQSYHYNAYPYDKFFVSMTATDKYTVEVKGKSRSLIAQVFPIVADMTGIFPPEIITAPGGIAEWKNVTGTGPYILVDYVPASSLLFKRNPNYWMKDPIHPENQLPYLDGVKMLIIPDLSTRISALRTGKVDVFFGANRDQALEIQRTGPGLKLVKYPSGSVTQLYYRVDNPALPWYDVRVRRALNMAVNQKEMLDTLEGGEGLLLSWPVGGAVEFKDWYVSLDELPQSARELYEYHPDKAKQLLKEAGYPNGFKVSALLYDAYVDLASIVKEYWAKIGVDLTLDVRELAVFTSIGNAKTYKEMIWGGAGTTFPNRIVILIPGSLLNKSIVDDPWINKKYDELAEAFFDRNKLRDVVREIVPYIQEQAWWLPLPVGYITNFWQPWVKSYNGEQQLGYFEGGRFTHYPWIDQDLREKLTGRK